MDLIVVIAMETEAMGLDLPVETDWEARTNYLERGYWETNDGGTQEVEGGASSLWVQLWQGQAPSSSPKA